MGKTIWFTMISLDGFATDRKNNIDFHTPNEEVHRYINKLNENTAVMILDRYGYEIMKYWDDPTDSDLLDEPVRSYAEQWKHIKKIIVDDTSGMQEREDYLLWKELTAERIDNLLDKVPGDVLVGSSSLAGDLLKLKKLNGIQILTVPVLLGTGTKNYADSGEFQLELIDYKIFENGWTYMYYKVLNER